MNPEVPLEDQPTLVDIPARGQNESAPSTRIGNYTLVGQLGEGGMGVVYEALQENPRRAVALKLIRGGGMVGEHAVRMFQREAQVLGRLRHAGIAAIYESGTTADGQHYFAMELVRGRRMDQVARELPPGWSRTALRPRLELFLQICAAVSYAHQRGVIHRDLKPGNILVQEAEGERGVKVLDFGLARLTEDEWGGGNWATLPGTVQGTIPYMSPEQVRGASELIDTRSDVYALGVILYEMLAGALPYDLRQASLPEAARRICEQAPVPLPAAASRELRMIVAKALAKEPGQRYQGVAGLAEDLQRYLADQPILAQSPSAMYQLRKLVTRHKLGFGAAAGAVLLLAAVAVAMTVQAGRIAAQRDRANRAAQVSQQETDFLVQLFQVSQPEQARGKTITARELLDRGAAGIQQNPRMDPEVKASLLDTMGNAYASLGIFAPARQLLDRALGLRQSRFGAVSLPVAETLRDRGLLTLDQGDDRGARADYSRALALYQQLEGADNRDVAVLLNDMGTSYDHVGRLEQAQQFFQRSLDMRIRLDGPNSPDLIPMRTNLAYIAYTRQDYAGAEQSFRAELAAAQQIYGPDHPFVSKLLNNLGGVLFTEKKYGEAEQFYRRAMALNRKLLGNDHPEIGLDLANIAEARDAQADLPGAEAIYRQALALLDGKVPAGDYRLRFVQTNLGSVLIREGGGARISEAVKLLHAALAADQKALPAGSWDIADVQSELGAAMLSRHQYAAAESLLVGSFPTLRAKLGANDPIVVERARSRIVQMYQEWGKLDKARRYALH